MRRADVIFDAGLTALAMGAAVAAPGALSSCPAIFLNPPRLTLDFTTRPGGRTLAHAQVDVSPGPNGDAGWNGCDPIRFWIAGKQQIALTSQTFVGQVGAMMRARIS